MKAAIFMGSPRKKGNTAQCLTPFGEELSRSGAAYTVTWLYDKTISPCIACRGCQKDWSGFNCVIADDMQDIAVQVMDSDLIVLATPIYSWYCTAPMKAMLDRLVYGLNKYYGEEVGPSLWAGKRLAVFTTCGYKPEHGADLFVAGMRRYCKHSKLTYVGLFAERHLGYNTVFMDEKKADHARQFARDMVQACSLG